MLNVSIVDLHQRILFRLADETLRRLVPFIAGLLLVDRAEFFLGLFDVVEGCSLINTCLSDSPVSCQDDIQISVCVVDQLELVKDEVSIRSILEVNLCEVCIPGSFVFVVINFVLLFTLDDNVEWNIVWLVTLLTNFFDSFLLCFSNECC